MARIPPAADAAVAPEARRELDRQLAAHGRVTNMKRTLAHSPAALRRADAVVRPARRGRRRSSASGRRRCSPTPSPARPTA